MYKWCKPCQLNDLKKNFTRWTSGNEKIDEFIQEMQLKINDYCNTILEWIPYNQVINIKKTGKNKIYSAILENSRLLKYDEYKKLYKRNSGNKYQKVSLKYYTNSQNNINEFFNEV